MENEIKITELDYTRLSTLIKKFRSDNNIEIGNLEALAREIKRAVKVDSKSIDPEFVTMNSEVSVLNLATKKAMTIKVVYPQDADFKKGYVSVISPLGSALLGYKVGDSVQFKAPRGAVTIRIQSVHYQPEANGEYLV